VAALSVRFEKGPQIKFNGLILGARFDLLNTYTIHIKFSRQYSEDSFKKLIDICQKLKVDQLS